MWRILHILMTIVFAFLFIGSFGVNIMEANKIFYLVALAYSVLATVLFLFVLKKESIIAQLFIYLSISMLYVFGCFITQNKPNVPATTFIVFLIISPLFMIDKPYFMGIEIIIASTIFTIWMYYVKPYEVWSLDLGNVVVYSVVGILVHIIANSIRIKEFVLSREIKIQKDTDDLTHLMNKGAITRSINDYLACDGKDKAIMFLLDINHFKEVNDTYGHDVGDSVINQFGAFLRETFKNGEDIGRFGGDEFIVFIKDTDDINIAKEMAQKIIDGVGSFVKLPDSKTISASIGISIYHGREKNYSEIFKKADVALYKTKADRSLKLAIYDEK